MADLIRNAKKASVFFRVSTKAALLVGGCAATGAGLASLSLPCSLGDVTSAWASFRSCLVPSYLFITVNLIVVAIWTLSQNKHSHNADEPLVAATAAEKPGDLGEESPPENLADTWHDLAVDLPSGSVEDDESSNASCLTVDSEDRSPVSSGLEITDPTDETCPEDTLDARWKAIMEGGASPVRRHLRKSETWERSSRAEVAPVSPVLRRAAAPPAMVAEVAVRKGLTKSETFREATVSGGGWRGREFLGGATRDEMDRKFEDFIRMNKEQMRLQRQESHQRYMESIRA